MDKKTTGIIVTLVAMLFCGCPGLVILFWGGLMAIISFIPGAEIDIMGSSDPQSALTTGIGGVCVGIIFIAIAVIVSVLMLRKKPAAAFSEAQIPPAE